MVLVPPLSPHPRFIRVPFPTNNLVRILSPFVLLPPLRPFLCSRLTTSSSGWAFVVRPLEDSFTTLRLVSYQMPFSWCPVQRPVCRFAPTSPDLCGWWYLAWVWVEGRRRQRPPRWSGVPRRVGRHRPG